MKEKCKVELILEMNELPIVKLKFSKLTEI